MMLKDKVVVVTGGAGLLGRSFVSAIAERGGVAVVADVDIDAAVAVARNISARYPERAEAEFLDVTDKDSVCALIERLRNRHGRIHCLVNSAYPRNRNYGRKLEDVSYADFCENINLHLGGYFLVAQQFAMYFRAEGGGNIVNMGSIYGIMAPRFGIYAGTPMTMPVEYAAIKSAVAQLTRYFAQYFKNAGVRVNCLNPGGVLDGQPADFLEAYNSHCNSKGMLAPQDLSGILAFLLSDDSQFITGQNLVADDGFSL